MRRGVYWRLSVMMFLQYAIWGAWFSYLSVYLTELGFSGKMMGVIFNLLPLGILLAPMTGGQLADRYFATEKILAFAGLIGGVLLFLVSDAIQLQDMAVMVAFTILSLTWFVYSVIFGPTLALTNSISFQNLTSAEKQFGAVRVWGTIGWIAAGWILTFWWKAPAIMEWFEAQPGITFYSLITFQWWAVETNINPNDCFRFAAIFSVLFGLFSFALPHTPPKREGVEPLAFVKAFRMLRDRNFLIFMLISFVVTTELYFYYILTGPFLTGQLGFKKEDVPFWMTTAQLGEIITMAILLPIILPRLGVRMSLLIGVVAWPIRYLVFAIGHPWWLVLAAMPLHGFCYVFFFVVGMIYVDNTVPKDIRASAQSLWAVFVLGFGAIVGGFFAGAIKDYFTQGTGETAVTNWPAVFSVPLVITIVCAVGLLIFFREPEKAPAGELREA